jgi:hypothetical protein
MDRHFGTPQVCECGREDY